MRLLAPRIGGLGVAIGRMLGRGPRYAFPPTGDPLPNSAYSPLFGKVFWRNGGMRATLGRWGYRISALEPASPPRIPYVELTYIAAFPHSPRLTPGCRRDEIHTFPQNWITPVNLELRQPPLIRPPLPLPSLPFLALGASIVSLRCLSSRLLSLCFPLSC